MCQTARATEAQRMTREGTESDEVASMRLRVTRAASRMRDLNLGIWRGTDKVERLELARSESRTMGKRG